MADRWPEIEYIQNATIRWICAIIVPIKGFRTKESWDMRGPASIPNASVSVSVSLATTTTNFCIFCDKPSLRPYCESCQGLLEKTSNDLIEWRAKRDRKKWK